MKTLILVGSTWAVLAAGPPAAALQPQAKGKTVPGAPAAQASRAAPEIQTLLKEKVYERALEKREIMSYAQLEKVEEKPPLRRYSFYFTMLARAGMSTSRRVLTDYELYEKMVPMVNHARFDADSRLLDVEGGIFNYLMRCWVRFEEVGDSWIRFEVVRGHFRGMKGDILFEDHGEKGTLVYFGGELKGREWPPAFILERGAEVVFSFVGRKMRSYLEAVKRSGAKRPGKETDKGENQNEQPIPQPRNRL